MAKQKLFRNENQSMLPNRLVDFLRSTGDPMHHQQGELWITGTVKKEALATLAELTGYRYYADRPHSLRLAQQDIYSVALREAGLPEPGELLFCHQAHSKNSPLYSLTADEGMTLRGHFQPRPGGEYGCVFVKIEEQS